MSDVFQEVDEELRRQRLDKVLRTYGPWVATAAIVLIAGFAGFTFWQNYKESRAAAAGDQMVQGMELLVRGNGEAAAAVFAGIADGAPEAYPMLARFQEASALRQAGDAAGALRLYDAIAANGQIPGEFRDLARLYGGLTALEDSSAAFEDIEVRLAPVAAGSDPWRFHAREALAFAAYRNGRYDEAAVLYRQLTDDPLTPSGVAARANEMLNLTEAASE